MTSLKNARRGRVLEVIAKYGKCMELISMDPNFHEITVGLYFKDGTGTVWTFSGRPGVEKRVEEIRDQLVKLGDMVPVEGTHNQARFPDGEMYVRPLRFLLRQAVEKPFGTRHPDGRIEIKDLRSPLQVIATPGAGRGTLDLSNHGRRRVQEPQNARPRDHTGLRPLRRDGEGRR